MEDKMIIDLYFKRDESSIKETDLKYGRYLRSISFNILYNDFDAEECLNDTYLKTWNCIPPTRPVIFSAFLAKINRNISINRYKKKNAEKRGGGQYEAALEEIENIFSLNDTDTSNDNDVAEAINRFLKNIEKEKRIMFVRRYWYFDSISKIAERMGYKESRVATDLFRIREKLKTFLKNEGIDLWKQKNLLIL